MVVGIIGGIAGGKSLASEILSTELGFRRLSSDLIALSMYEPGQPVYEELRARFGESILTDGVLDKAKLKELIYLDKASHDEVESIVHPPVIAFIDSFTASHLGEDIAIETALPWEGLKALTDLMIFIRASREVRIRRLIMERGVDRDLALRIMSVQPADDTYLKFSDVVIDNDVNPEALRLALMEAIDAYR